MIYKFSVSNIRLTSIETAYTKEITTTKSIEINYIVTTTREIGADGIATNEYKDEERITISFEYNDNIDTSLIAGKRYNIELLTGTEGGGISITLNNCLLTSYATRLSQDEFVNIRVEFSKIGAIDSPETMPTQQRVKFDGIYLGDTAHLTTTLQGNVVSRIIPTALGTIFQTTSQMGGGLTSLSIKAKVKKDTRLELEQYVTSLFASLATSKKSLVVEYGVTSYTITNCVLLSGRMSSDFKNYCELEFEFQKSTY